MEDSGKKQSGNQSDLNLVRRRLDPSLAELVPVQGSYREEGQIFLDRLTEDLCHLLKKRMVWVAEYLPETLELLTVSVRFSGDHPKLPLRYPIRGGPCEAAYDTEALVHIPDRLIELFPENPHLKSLGALSYLAVPLRSQEGRLIGHFAVLDDLPMSVSKELSFFFHALQDRVSQELQRVLLDRGPGQREGLVEIGLHTRDIAHDLKNDISTVRYLAEAASRSVPPDLAAALRAAIESLQQGVESILHTSAVPALRPVLLGIHPLLEQLASQFGPMFEMAGRSFVVENLAPGLTTLRADPRALDRILKNIIWNSFRAVPRPGWTRLQLKTDSTSVLFIISDNGPGIPPDRRQRIFDPYFSTGGRGNFGLGLAASRRLALAHNGSLDLDDFAEGASFTLRLPIREE